MGPRSYEASCRESSTGSHGEESALCEDELGGAHTERTYTFQKRLPGLSGSFSEGENAFKSQPSTSWNPQPGHLWSLHQGTRRGRRVQVYAHRNIHMVETA